MTSASDLPSRSPHAPSGRGLSLARSASAMLVAVAAITLSAFTGTGCGTALDASTEIGTSTYAGTGSGSTGGGTGGTYGTGGGAAVLPLYATAVAVGASHSCALLTGGEVACWGDGSSGQLGDGIAMAGYSRATAAIVPYLTGVKAIYAGGDTTCAVLDASVMCWGDGTYGQLGDGQASAGYYEPSPVAVQGIGAVRSLSISDATVCAIATDGTALCWGRNSADGWLGFTSADCGPYPTSSTSVEQPCEKAPRLVPDIAAALTVSTSSDHCCATLSGGGVSCWGADTYGQLGDGFSGTSPHDPAPIVVAGVTGATRVAAGTSFTCDVSGAGDTVYCWGDNSYGQLAIGSAALDSNQSTPVMASLDGVVDLDAAEGAACAVLASGTVKCWGQASALFSSNVTGDATTTTDAPLLVPDVKDAVSVRTSGAHACALLADHTVKCWGRDDVGQLGDGQQSLGGYAPSAVLAP